MIYLKHSFINQKWIFETVVDKYYICLAIDSLCEPLVTYKMRNWLAWQPVWKYPSSLLGTIHNIALIVVFKF